MPSRIHRGGTHKAVYTYVHDKWQMRPDITLDLGLRHELYIPLVGYTPVGGQATYDPDTNTIRVAGYGDVPENLGVKTYWKNFNPRTGISWRLNETNVFRAGYGVSALGLPSSWGQAYPIRQVQQITPANSFAPTATNLATGMPAPALRADSATAAFSMPRRCVAKALDVIDAEQDARARCTRSTSRISASLPGGFTAEVAYVGNRGHDILAAYNMNAGSSLGADNAGRPLFTTVWQNGRHVGPACRSDPSTTRCRSRSTAACGTVCSLTNSYTSGRAYSFANGDGRRDDLHAGRLGAWLAADDVRFHA